MKVGIIGAGFAGLSAAYNLSKRGVDVTVYERESVPGGLAIGFTEKRWKWSLEKHYHHWFVSDWAVRNLAQEVGHEVTFKRPKTSVYIDDERLQLDSPISLLRFSKLPLTERLRTGLVLAYLKFTPNWKALESITAERFLKKYGGKTSWEILWRPLFNKKFSKFSSEIPASWFWARIKKRSSSLGYPKGGFASFAKKLDRATKKLGAKFYYDTNVESIRGLSDKIVINTGNKKDMFDKVICTLPSFLFIKVVKNLPEAYKKSLLNLQSIGAVNLILSLKKPFLVDGTYWLNINDLEFPFLAIVEHTNFMSKKYYNNEHLIYVGNYLPHEHEYYKREAEDLVKEFLPYLKKINPDFNKSWINKAYLFKAPFAQPIIPLNYSKILPKLETPIKGLYLANIQQVYPWDRGTNYAVELGEKVAELVIKSQ